MQWWQTECASKWRVQSGGSITAHKTYDKSSWQSLKPFSVKYYITENSHIFSVCCLRKRVEFSFSECFLLNGNGTSVSAKRSTYIKSSSNFVRNNNAFLKIKLNKNKNISVQSSKFHFENCAFTKRNDLRSSGLWRFNEGELSTWFELRFSIVAKKFCFQWKNLWGKCRTSSEFSREAIAHFDDLR